MRTTLLSLAALALLAGCADSLTETAPEPATGGQEVDVTACRIASTRVDYTDDGTQTVATWATDDAINLYALTGATTDRGTLRFVAHTTADKTAANFRGRMDRDLTAPTEVYAYAKYPAVYNRQTAIVNDLHYQSGLLTGVAGAATHDVLFAHATYDPEATTPLTLNFERRMTLARIRIALPQALAGAELTACTLTGGGMKSEVRLNIADATEQSSTEGAITIAPAALRPQDGTLTIWAALCPGQVESASVVLTTAAGDKYAAMLGDLTLTAGATQTVEATSVERLDEDTFGHITDSQGQPMAGVVVSDGYTVVETDAQGRYALNRNAAATHVFITVPADCEIPTHSATDHTACFYHPLVATQYAYDFQLTRLPGGKETGYTLIVMGDPQVTPTPMPLYTDASDNSTQATNLSRFSGETMADIGQYIASLPASTPVYGLCMGDVVQYWGGYNAGLELAMREQMGSTRMRLFSVIGNHDQQGNTQYKAKWKEVWGPDDYSFDRGDVHYVCMNDVFEYSGATYYQPGELHNTQYSWLEQDLAHVDKSKRVVLCYHVPLAFGNRAYSQATSTGSGHYYSSRLASIMELLKPFAGYELFCGHTHFAVNNELTLADGTQVYERSHAAAGGDIWNSNLNIDGTPNGYYVYEVSGAGIQNCFYKSTRLDKNKQFSLFRADTDFNGESYAADWSLNSGKGTVVANVFNGDSHWSVVAVEDGVETEMTRLQGTPGQDAFAVGYHHKYATTNQYSFFSKQNGYLRMNHLYYYQPKDPAAVVTVRATDRYGHTYTETTGNAVTSLSGSYAHYYAQ